MVEVFLNIVNAVVENSTPKEKLNGGANIVVSYIAPF